MASSSQPAAAQATPEPTAPSVPPTPSNTALKVDIESPKGYTATLGLDIPPPEVVLGDPGKLQLNVVEGAATIDNTTEGGRPVPITGSGIVSEYYSLPKSISNAVEFDCSGVTNSARKWLIVERAYGRAQGEYPAGISELALFPGVAIFGDADGHHCLRPDVAQFSEDQQEAISNALSAGPTYVQVEQDGFGFADGIANYLCRSPSSGVGYEFILQMTDTSGGALTFDEARNAPVGLCNVEGAEPPQ